MNISVSFSDEFLISRYEKDDPLIFYICWEHEGVFYPGQQWDDFGAVILVWWLRATWELSEGATETEYLFMDGPYGIQASFERETSAVTLRPQGEPYSWTVTFDQLAAALVAAAETVRDKLARLGIAEKDRRSLEFGIRRLDQAGPHPPSA